ncbi:HAD family hydrolase [Pelagibaculum spongiae]|uniref:HAD-IB family hydrolase n=1 Tax=Pelagibaculum spongiae TaxID=2080658 RepID=A0A2V1H345_9GAMM|nr:HAD family hydrolase [Pelagibaculum spongiae]PVZ72400.1 HAD-IB family hydrolase [Pelagibaculum spongiae]
MSLAIFDLDNTLIKGDSDHSWGEFLVQKGIVDTQAFKQANDLFYQQYNDGQLDINEYLRFTLQPLTQFSMQQLAELQEEFMREVIEPIILPDAEALLQKHRDQGDYLLIISATNEFVVGPIAKRFKVDHAIACQVEIIDGRYTGKPIGIPSFQAGKITRLESWLEDHPQHSMQDAWFYSDSRNDLPLLEQVARPIAVDADETLTARAKQAGWPIISLR